MASHGESLMINESSRISVMW